LDEVFSNREALTGIGLDVPVVTRILLRLRAMGLDVDTRAYTLEGAIKAIRNCGGGCQSPAGAYYAPLLEEPPC